METDTRKITYRVHPHEVKFIEDLKIEGKEGDLCHVCDELLSVRGFKCPECNFLCHESCGLLDKFITHPLHPHHSFELRMPFRYRYCDACGKCCSRCFSYCCTKCDFTLDTTCTSRWRVKNACDKHAFIPLAKHIQFTCEFCSEEGKDNGCICGVCLLTIHSKCARLSPTIKIANHPHSLALTYSTHEEEKQKKQEVGEEKEEAEIVCKLCSDKVNTKYASYFCQECRYAVHLKCGRNREVTEERDEITRSLPIEHHGSISHIINDINQAVIGRSLARTINHLSHQHVLILDPEEVVDDKVCDGCIQPISFPFYGCNGCNFFLHSLCANLPANATYGEVPRNYNLSLQDGVFFCSACRRHRHGFAYKREVYRSTVDLQCFITQGKILHEGHQHPLFGRITPKCNCCERRGFFSCSPCNFSLCETCATFPLEVSCKFHDHPLKMTYTIEDDFEEHYCFICEKKRNPKYWFYYCVTCDFFAHFKCVVKKYSYIKFGKIYKDEGHRHPLTFVQKTFDSLPCDACGSDFEGVALHCKECKFNVHPDFDPSSRQCLKKIDDLKKND